MGLPGTRRHYTSVPQLPNCASGQEVTATGYASAKPLAFALDAAEVASTFEA